jgi:hypothetical protein
MPATSDYPRRASRCQHRPLGGQDRQTQRTAQIRRPAHPRDRCAGSSNELSISRNCRLGRDFERYARTVTAFVRLAMIRIMLRRLTRPTHST